ncbi:hypothetical protein JKP88DRAFT_244201 [Tribonema minus]|uniref:Uncharacterized protein n=1 Tax=Tribonema minus TaxID=303371 RepID=A0A835Z4R9_9STRA|nr:hypothetical protein JKP88DRAFT_244201 [Tribonema minus]
MSKFFRAIFGHGLDQDRRWDDVADIAFARVLEHAKKAKGLSGEEVDAWFKTYRKLVKEAEFAVRFEPRIHLLPAKALSLLCMLKHPRKRDICDIVPAAVLVHSVAKYGTVEPRHGALDCVRTHNSLRNECAPQVITVFAFVFGSRWQLLIARMHD